jgi:hypothetical protein
MAIRRRALQRIGPFDVSLEHGGDEQEWQDRLLAEHGSEDRPSARVLYVAGAALRHRRSPADARLRALCRAARARGRAARRFDTWRRETDRQGNGQEGEQPPTLLRELHTLAACIGHVVRYRCPAGLVMAAHSVGRVEQALSRVEQAQSHVEQTLSLVEQAQSRAESNSATDDFLSGESGTVGGIDGLRRAMLDTGADALQRVSGRGRRLDRAALRAPPTRRVLVLGVERPEHRELAERIRAELAGSRHTVELHLAAPGGRGKFENLNLLLAANPPKDHDWLLVVDDDILLPRGFLDRFLFLAERFRLQLAQPAHLRASHAAWRVTRRQPGSVVRETSFVEIGPVTAFASCTFSTLLPFPELRMGWGLDLHWAALAREHGWRGGVLDAVPIAHRAAPAGSAYSREQALAEARAFLRERPYLSASEAQRTLVTHRRW